MPCCETCACIGSGVECLGVVAPGAYGHFREWCASDDALRRALVLARSLLGLCPDPSASDPAPEAPIPASASLALLGRMKSCPSWVKSSDCGCGLNRCNAGKGTGGVVSHADCFACLQNPAGQDSIPLT